MSRKSVKKYVLSSNTFESLKAVEDALLDIEKKNGLRPGTRVFEVVAVTEIEIERTPRVIFKGRKIYGELAKGKKSALPKRKK